LAEKATKTEVAAKADQTALSSLQTQITNIGNGSPKGTYASLTALQTAFPTGTTGVYVVTADGKWYYWNGSTWTAGGVYQSTGISDNSITSNKLDAVLLAKSVVNDKLNDNLYKVDNDNTNFDLSVATTDGVDWYLDDGTRTILTYIEACSNPFLVDLGIKNWVHFDVGEAYNYGVSRTVHFVKKYSNTVKGKYFQVVYFVYSANGVIGDFNNNSMYVSTNGGGPTSITPSEVVITPVAGQTGLYKVRKSGLIPTNADYVNVG
jgi:hypothetical protein